ncbi:DMT family transporter [Haloprofundus salinisoli]|uniref:DMT family transporter n=1 Tax=Haloprofundus salinisoli TaxID=2876193 RepID=UPI001CCEDF22|nr:DMT family transporter [Haloprofundus salinisoli]
MSRNDAALFVGIAAVWGTAFVATKAALDSFPPVTLASLRFSLAALALFVVVFAARKRWLPNGRGDWLPILTGGAFNIGLHHALLFAGQQYVSAALAATLLGLVPVATPVFARLARHDDSLSATGAIGVLVGFLSVVLMAQLDPDDLSASVGAGLVLASAIAWVLGAVLTREDDATLSPVSLQAWTLLVGAALLSLATLVLPGESLAPLAVTSATPEALGWLVYLALIPGAAGFFAYFRLLDRIGPIQAGLLEYAIPPFAALFGFVVLRETLDATTIAGFFGVFVAFLLVKSDSIAALLDRRRDRAESVDSQSD